MILSNNRLLGEHEAIRLPGHVGRVWEEIASRLPRYWQAFVDRELAKQPTVELAAHFNSSKQKSPSTASVVTQAFAVAVQQYEKSASKSETSSIQRRCRSSLTTRAPSKSSSGEGSFRAVEAP